MRVKPKTTIVTITSADTEYTHVLNKNCQKFTIQCRTAADIRFAFENGKVATPTDPYNTLKSGTSYTVDDFVVGKGLKVYFAAASGSLSVEVLEWHG